MASSTASCFLHPYAAAAKTTTSNRYVVPSLKPVVLVCRAQKQQHVDAQEADAAVVSRKFALTLLIGAAAVGSKVSPADAAYGESANIFGRPKTNPDFKQYTGNGFKLSIPSKWNPSNEVEFPGQVLRYEDNFDATSNLSVSITPSDKKSITDLWKTSSLTWIICSVNRRILGKLIRRVVLTLGLLRRQTYWRVQPR